MIRSMPSNAGRPGSVPIVAACASGCSRIAGLLLRGTGTAGASGTWRPMCSLHAAPSLARTSSSAPTRPSVSLAASAGWRHSSGACALGACCFGVLQCLPAPDLLVLSLRGATRTVCARPAPCTRCVERAAGRAGVPASCHMRTQPCYVTAAPGGGGVERRAAPWAAAAGEGSRVAQSVLGRSVKVGRNCDITGSYVQDNVTIQVRCVVWV